MVELLDFINRNGIAQNLWAVFHGNTGQTWKDLYGCENTELITNDHVTIWWNCMSMCDSMFKWLVMNSDKNSFTSDGEILFHFFID